MIKSQISFVLLLLSTLFFVESFATSCARQTDCFGVSTHPQAVQCNNQSQCECMTDYGFIGSAVPEDKCRCVSPKSVERIRHDVYCIDLPTSIKTTNVEEKCDRLMQKVTEIYGYMVYPICKSVIVGNISVTNLFSSDVKFRVNPWGNFVGYQSTLEFFYGLVSFNYDQVVSINIEKLTCSNNMVTAQMTQTNRFIPGYPLPPMYNITQMAMFTFDPSTELVISGEISLLNPGALLDLPNIAIVRDGAINNTCQVFTGPSGYSNLPNGTCPEQWNGTTNAERKLDCFNFIKSVSFGSWNRANSNSYVCRQLHSLFTALRPEVHCPHIGKTGGNTCVDFAYTTYYNEKY